MSEQVSVFSTKPQCNVDTDWHVYDRDKCVLDLEHVPTLLYHLTCETANGCDVISDEWFDDKSKFEVAFGMYDFYNCVLLNSDVKDMSDCVTIVDDDDCPLVDYDNGVVLQVACRESC